MPFFLSPFFFCQQPSVGNFPPLEIAHRKEADRKKGGQKKEASPDLQSYFAVHSRKLSMSVKG